MERKDYIFVLLGILTVNWVLLMFVIKIPTILLRLK